MNEQLMPTSAKVTMREVAREARVAIGTVSGGASGTALTVTLKDLQGDSLYSKTLPPA